MEIYNLDDVVAPSHLRTVVTSEKIVVSNRGDYRAVLWREEWRRSSGPWRKVQIWDTDGQESHGEIENLSAICTLQSKSKS
ncbi:hypothetical protein ACFX13_036870 [Malus domestica]